MNIEAELEQLISRLNSLEAQSLADRAEIAALKTGATLIDGPVAGSKIPIGVQVAIQRLERFHASLNYSPTHLGKTVHLMKWEDKFSDIHHAAPKDEPNESCK